MRTLIAYSLLLNLWVIYAALLWVVWKLWWRVSGYAFYTALMVGCIAIAALMQLVIIAKFAP